MPRRPRRCIADMLGAIDYIREDLTGCSYDDFLGNRVIRQAVERNIEVVSEASRVLPEELVNTEPEIDWRGVRTIGNILRHRYGDVSPKELWDGSVARLPKIQQALLRMDARLALAGADDPKRSKPLDDSSLPSP